MQPYAVGPARLALEPIRFNAGLNGVTRVATQARVDGPFSGGQVRALQLPINGWFGRGAFAFGEGCTAVGFDALRYGTLALAPTRLPVCPIGRALLWKPPGGAVQGGGQVTNLRLDGQLGS
jgi:hypothetical protein